MTPSEEVTIRNLAGPKPGEATVNAVRRQVATLRAEIQILAEQRDALRVELAESEEWGCQYRDEVVALRARVKDLESQGRLSRFVGDVLGAAWRAAR